jgi:hypothetical protein
VGPAAEVQTETEIRAHTGAGDSSLWPRLPRNAATRFAAVSAALLIPVYWHKRIEAGDLGSHLYNAWLAQLVRQGQAPGLWIARQWNNVLYDLLLSWLGSAFGLRAAEKIAVSLVVLTFFWGAFALIAAATRRAPWKLAPLVAVFAYGWTFEMGFMNYYLSLGLCFLALAAYLRFGNLGGLITLALIPLIWMAHPLGVICLAGMGAYVILAKAVPPLYHGFLLVAAGIFLVGLRMYLARRYQVRWNVLARYFFFNGADQLMLYSARYDLLYLLFAALLVSALVVAASGQNREGGFWKASGIPVQLYVAAGMASILLPTRVVFPHYPAALSFLTPRLTSVSGILACWMLGALRPRKWVAIGGGLLAAAFFVFLYIDTGALNNLEERVERSVAALPAGHRVVSDIQPMENSRMVIEHIVDRACIERCFSYDNYEPPSALFRVRAAPGNSIVYVADAGEAGEPAAGPEKERVGARMKALDPPVFDISPCSANSADICVRELSPDEIGALVEGKFEY